MTGFYLGVLAGTAVVVSVICLAGRYLGGTSPTAAPKPSPPIAHPPRTLYGSGELEEHP